MPDKKTGAINGRISGQLRARLNEIYRRWGPSDATMLEDALTALADYVERSGKYERPMKMIFDDDAAEFQRSQAAEAAGETPTVKRLTQEHRKDSEAKAAAGAKPSRAGRR